MRFCEWVKRGPGFRRNIPGKLHLSVPWFSVVRTRFPDTVVCTAVHNSIRTRFDIEPQLYSTIVYLVVCSRCMLVCFAGRYEEARNLSGRENRVPRLSVPPQVGGQSRNGISPPKSERLVMSTWPGACHVAPGRPPTLASLRRQFGVTTAQNLQVQATVQATVHASIKLLHKILQKLLFKLYTIQ